MRAWKPYRNYMTMLDYTRAMAFYLDTSQCTFSGSSSGTFRMSLGICYNFSKEPTLGWLGLASFDAFAHLNIAEALNLQPSLILVFAVIFVNATSKSHVKPRNRWVPFWSLWVTRRGFLILSWSYIESETHIRTNIGKKCPSFCLSVF